MHLQISSPARRFATLFVAALLVFVTVMPMSAARCCRATSASMAAMHAAMPCCSHCKLSSPANSSDADLTAISAPAPAAPLLAVAATADAPQQTAPGATVDHSAAAAELSPPSPFLLHEQFRI